MYVVGIRDSNFWGRPGSFISGKVFLGPINEGQRQVRAPEGVSQLVHTGCTSTSQVHRVPQQRRHVHASHILHSFPISSLIDTLTSECWLSKHLIIKPSWMMLVGWIMPSKRYRVLILDHCRWHLNSKYYWWI